ncbi:hypothetical protein KGF57_004319 [Candida theae]|uniref:Uncharacterized protein n=1 Tax=Candida theae TaxID=1198502 RepID=A0AAD5FX18_9ASCO|nr:uncharacterized protein KGF57_004319 [Candida theae]KAI5950450.1 hypothetical protein KGF57_004319 [Candida theae]
MLGLGRSARIATFRTALNAQCIAFTALRSGVAHYSTKQSDQAPAPTKTKKKKSMNIANVPLAYIGVMSDLYIPPRLLKYSPLSWPKLMLRRLLTFAFNTYNVIKYKREIAQPLQFNEWKDKAIENYVKTNKIFAQACNNFTSTASSSRDVSKFINLKLNQCCGKHLIDVLNLRAANFQPNYKISWDLKSIDANPKISMFSVIPDQDGIGCFVQFIMKLKTTQQVTVTERVGGKLVQDVESQSTDYLVYSMNPFNGQILLVGKLFESDDKRGLKPELDAFDAHAMQKFVLKAADIYRDGPN